MEKKTIIIKKINKVFTLREAFAFGWAIESEIDQGTKVVINLVRDDSVPYYQELVKLEKSFIKPKCIPVWVLLIPMLLTVILVTCYLVFVAIKKDIPSHQGILLFMLPSGLFGLLLGILGILRTRQVVKYMNEYEKNYKEVVEKIKQIKGD